MTTIIADVDRLLGRLAECFSEDEQEFADIKQMRDRLALVMRERVGDGEPISDARLRNTRAWAAARVGQMSGAEVIVGAIDEVLQQRNWQREG